MNRVHKNLADKSFEKYTNKVVKKTYCMETGLLASDQCPKTASGWYKTSMIPATCKSCNGEIPEESTTGANTGESTTTPNESTTLPPETTTQAPTPPPEVTETPAA
jgi:penicillin-binding protein 1A